MREPVACPACNETRVGDRCSCDNRHEASAAPLLDREVREAREELDDGITDLFKGRSISSSDLDKRMDALISAALAQGRREGEAAGIEKAEAMSKEWEECAAENARLRDEIQRRDDEDMELSEYDDER